jgi:DNA-binding transcriptional ArsR family regulator
MRPTQDADTFHAIAHPARRAILGALRGHERAAGELAAPFDMTFGAVSQHLKILEDAGLIRARRDGRRRLYRLEPAPLDEVVDWLDGFAAYLSGRLDALGDYLDRTHGKPAAAPTKRRRPR